MFAAQVASGSNLVVCNPRERGFFAEISYEPEKPFDFNHSFHPMLNLSGLTGVVLACFFTFERNRKFFGLNH